MRWEYGRVSSLARTDDDPSFPRNGILSTLRELCTYWSLSRAANQIELLADDDPEVRRLARELFLKLIQPHARGKSVIGFLLEMLVNDKLHYEEPAVASIAALYSADAASSVRSLRSL